MKKLRVLGNAGDAKTMLPEVLPDPRRTAAPSGPRARTVAHMQRLLAAATALGVVGAAGATTTACGKTTKVPGEDDAKDGGGKANPDQGSSSGNSSGYAVVDPMPPPAHCAGVAQLVRATAKFVKAGKDVHLVVRFPNPVGRDDFKYNGKVATTYGGNVVGTDAKPDAVTVTLKPDADATTATVGVKGNCNAGPSSILANVRWSGPIDEKTTPTITLGDLYDY